MVKTTYPDEKGISSSDSRETNEKRQMQETGNGSNQVSCEFYPSGLSLSPQPRETFEWNLLANMTKTPFVLLLPELGPPEISLSISQGSFPFSNWEITPGLESSYPAHGEEKTVCAEVKKPFQEFQESSLVFRFSEGWRTKTRAQKTTAILIWYRNL